jgi:hypothetical protein
MEEDTMRCRAAAEVRKWLAAAVCVADRVPDTAAAGPDLDSLVTEGVRSSNALDA